MPSMGRTASTAGLHHSLCALPFSNISSQHRHTSTCHVFKSPYGMHRASCDPTASVSGMLPCVCTAPVLPTTTFPPRPRFTISPHVIASHIISSDHPGTFCTTPAPIHTRQAPRPRASCPSSSSRAPCAAPRWDTPGSGGAATSCRHHHYSHNPQARAARPVPARLMGRRTVHMGRRAVITAGRRTVHVGS